MGRYESTPKTRLFIKKILVFNLVWGILSVGVLLLVYMLGIKDFGMADGIMLSFVFGGETIFHYRLLDQIKEMCNERYPLEPWKARQEYKSHLFVLIGMAIICAIGVFSLLFSLITLWIS